MTTMWQCLILCFVEDRNTLDNNVLCLFLNFDRAQTNLPAFDELNEMEYAR